MNYNKNISEFENAFNVFMSKSSFSLLSTGSIGVVIKAVINPSEKSPYYSFRQKNYGQEVRELVIKIVLTHDDCTVENDNNPEFAWFIGDNQMNHSPLEIFKKELEIQTLVTTRTLEYLEPLCPIIVFSEICSDTEKSLEFMKLIDRNFVGKKNVIRDINVALNTKKIKKVRQKEGVIANVPYTTNSKIAFIAMELVDTNFKSLFHIFTNEINRDFNLQLKMEDLSQVNHLSELAYDNDLKNIYDESKEIIENIVKRTNIDTFKNMARIDLIELASKTGYTQGDYHFGNLLVDKNYEGYYSSKDFDFPNIDNNDNNINKNIASSFEDMSIFGYDSDNMSTPSPSPKKEEMKGGEIKKIDKGKVIIIDFGYANKIMPYDLGDIQENMREITKKLDTIDQSVFDYKINECLNIIFNTMRNDGSDMDYFHPRYYGWFVGKYLCSQCGPNVVFIQEDISEKDYDEMRGILISRRNAIENLKRNAIEDNFPLSLPLTEDYIIERIFNTGHMREPEKVYANVGGKNTRKTYEYETLIDKCFDSIGYGLKSIIAVNNKIDKILLKKRPIKKMITGSPYKMLSDKMSKMNKPISIKTGGKTIKRKKNIKKKKGRKTRNKKSNY